MMLDRNLYDMIFKRKLFHLFRNLNDKEMSASEVDAIEHKFNSLISLKPEIKTEIRVVPAADTSCKRGQQFCIMLY
ncbi:MAG: nitroreductase, partial [Clostridiales bacterium]|nr:nitroreductase [Clostridiales bacterium]